MRAGNGTRTRDPNLGKVMLYQLSYSRVNGAKIRIFFYLQNWGTIFPESFLIYLSMSMPAARIPK